MTYEPRTISFLGRGGRLKHYGIALGDREPREPLVTATARRAEEVVPEDAPGFTIAHDAAGAGIGIVYWWENENEIFHRVYVAPLDDVGRLEPTDATGMACAWDLEVIDFERRAWLEDVLKAGDTERYLERALEQKQV